MSENVEYPKLSTDEQTKKAEKDVQLLDLKPEDRVFLDVLSLSIQNNKNINEFHYGILNRGIVRAIAELDITTALRIVNQESQTRSPRIEVLAELAKMALVRGMDVNSVDPILKQIETAVEADDFYLAWASDVPVLLMDASLSLEDVKPALAQRIFNLAIEIVTGKKDSKRFDLYRHESDAKAFMTQIIATKDPSRAEEFIQKYNVRNSRDSDVEPIQYTIQKYLEQGQLDAAFRVALQSGNVPSIAEVGVRIAKEDPQKLIHSITEKYVTRKKPWPASPGMAAQAYDYMASLLFQSGDSSVAEKLLQEARGLAEQQGKEGYEQLVKILSYRHPDEAIQLLDKIHKPSKHSGTYNRLINEIAMRTVLHDATKAIEIYHLSTSSSLGKQDALVTLLVECKKQEKDTHVEFLLNEFKGNIIELKNTSHIWGAERMKISFENIYKISNYFPELALEIIREGVGQEPKIRGREMTDQLTVKKILEILERAGLSAEQKQEWIEFLSRKLFLREKEAFISGLLHNISTRSPELLSEKGILSFFLSLDPGKPDDIRTFEALLKSGLLPEQNIKESPQKNLTQFLSVSALLLSQELVKKQDFDFLLFDHLMKLSQAENSFVKEVALHAIKLLPRKIGELFYMSDDAALETLKKLFSLSPETQLWFNDLDNYIANEFYPLGNNLLRFVKKLASQGVNQLLPKSMEKARKTILLYLSENVDLADYFLENLQLYYTEPWILQGMELAITHFSVAQKFMKAVDNGHEEWKQMPWVADVYAKAKEIKPENEEGWNTAHGEKLQGFSDRDPYENHHWKFTGAQIGLASSLADVLRSKANKESINQLGLSAESLQILRKIEQQINTAYNNFLSTINLSDAFPREDKLALLYPEKGSVKMTDLRENIQSFVARYLVQKVEGDVETLNKNLADIAKNLENILQEGLNRFLKVYEVDIPLYDKLYEEFDSLREAGQHPLEVYLGRDGIYAWLGRRAQDVARRRKLGFERRKQSKESGEVLEIKPKYLIYPRYYRDNINIETKREFLEQEGISPMADPLFYDTGYTGTIPEQIMKVMNFDSDEIDRRIRLLSASNVQRRVRGVPENARSEIIEYIEHNAKTENSAVGLIKDPQTGKIRPIAEPTGPEEQFYFMMVKQAIGRHYWLKEQLHHGPSESVNLDSEHFVIRVLQEYAPLFPSEFLSDPQTYLAKHGELLKGSQGEGEYPDEEILLFKLSDDTQIVAKRIELRKAKEARKEFSILIAARKAHLPTAEPVGFLSGKTEADHSYLLMKKIEGFSGRKFEKYLQESGKYSDEQIKSIMQTVTEKNKEMAELFRQTLSIDKRWRIKDTIIAFNEETGQVTGVTPIDWERVQIFDPSNPKQIDDSQ